MSHNHDTVAAGLRLWIRCAAVDRGVLDIHPASHLYLLPRPVRDYHSS
ncbi:MAG: hypothetical protein WAN71_13610 [Mycobacterium sp.]